MANTTTMASTGHRVKFFTTIDLNLPKNFKSINRIVMVYAFEIFCFPKRETLYMQHVHSANAWL